MFARSFTASAQIAPRGSQARGGIRIEVGPSAHGAGATADDIDVDLRATAIPGIKEFVAQISERWDHERRDWQWNAPRDRNGVQLPARHRMDQIRDITARAEALYFEPDPEVAEAELAKLKHDLEAPLAAVA